jgi:hypothetical protein
VARGGGSLARAREGVPGGQNGRGKVLRVEGKRANMPRGQEGNSGIHGGRRWKRADRLHRRAWGVDAERKEKEKVRDCLSHHTETLRKCPRARKEQRRR